MGMSSLCLRSLIFLAFHSMSHPFPNQRAPNGRDERCDLLGTQVYKNPAESLY
jgi:hypothetical protein